ARKGQPGANVSPEERVRLDALGRERALIYKTLVLTGLRKNELASLTVAQVHLDGPAPYLELDAADEKNREGGSSLLIRADLAEDLRRWLADQLAALQGDAHHWGAPIPARLPGENPLFDVPRALIRIFDRDIKAAGIPKRDERGRVLDVHALRTTFGTLLSKFGVPLRTAQAAMRHSDPKLTANVYCDPKLLDVRGGLDSLPSLPLTLPGGGQEQARATGTYGAPVQDFVAPDVALPPGDERASLATAGNPSTEGCLPDGTGKPIEDNGFGDPCVSLTIPGKGTDHHPMPGPNGRAPAISADAHRSSARPRRSSSAAGASGRGPGGGRRA
ncbi:MAG: site-specific integrase, partial [Planctomycetaceae bacterium]|nr:site-specific integrase [Planctomycetaceae bacterium]